MKRKNAFFSSVCAIAIPAALQSMLQSSFGIVDQIMIGQMGTIPVAAVGLAGKFTMLTTIGQDHTARAKLAVELLIKLREQSPVEPEILLPVKLIQRSSTASVRAQSLPKGNV